jgi:hypothetical protein
MSEVNSTTELDKILFFLNEIGITIIEKKLDESTFLPGLTLGPNCIYIDYEKLGYPGDILHEAGHIAVTSPTDRAKIGTETMAKDWPSQGEEIATMLWSFAACKHLDLPLEYVFHAGGYKGSSNWLMDNFETGNYIGLPFFEWTQMAYSKEKSAEMNVVTFPKMVKWVREKE